MRFRIKNLWLPPLLALSLLAGCKKDYTISPEDGSSDVPVNAIVQIEHRGSSPLDREQIENGAVRLSECPSGGLGLSMATSQAGAKAQAAGEKKAETQEAEKQEQGAKPVSAVVRAETFPKAVTNDDGTMGTEWVTRIRIHPVALAGASSPLTKSTQYCVEIDPLQTSSPRAASKYEEGDAAEAGEILAGAKFTFRTEEAPGLIFTRDAAIEEPVYPSDLRNVNQADALVVKFSRPVRSEAVRGNTKVCIAKESSQTTAAGDELSCAQFDGTENSIQIQRVVPLLQYKGALVDPHRYFAVWGSPSFPKETEGNRLLVGVEEGNVVPNGEQGFAVSGAKALERLKAQKKICEIVKAQVKKREGTQLDGCFFVDVDRASAPVSPPRS